MAKLYYVFSLFSVLWVSSASGQALLATHGAVSLRGLSASPGAIWVSGSAGTVGHSTDGGLHWKWVTVPGYTHTDFRDVEGFDSLTALIMGIDTPAVILRTADGGRSWRRVFYDATPGMFLDAMSFAGGLGYVVGDPIPDSTGLPRFFVAGTTDQGRHWKPLSYAERPLASSGEGCFASSGTNILARVCRIPPTSSYTICPKYAFVSGGPFSRLFRDEYVGGLGSDTLPVLQGTTSTGANSLSVRGWVWIVVGGDFQHDTASSGNCVYSLNDGFTWQKPHTPPHGYRSCVAWLWKDTWICCGTSGVDVSTDNGDHWNLVSRESYHVVAYPGSGRTVYLAGSRGRVAKLTL